MAFLNEENINKILYHGSPHKFREFKDKLTFFSETEQFAEEYASQKSMDYALDEEPNLYEVRLKTNIFDINDPDDFKKLEARLPEKAEVYLTNFPMSSEIDKNTLLNSLRGKGIERPLKDIDNKNIGDTVQTYDLSNYVLYKKDSDYAYGYDSRMYNYAIESLFKDRYDISSNYRELIKGTEPLIEYITNLYKDKNNKKYVYSNDIARTAYALKGGKHGHLYGSEEFSDEEKKQFADLYEKALSTIKENLISKGYIKKFILKPVDYEMKDTWRYFENDTVVNIISDLGYGGYVAKEDGVNTYAVFNPKQDTEIISFQFPSGYKFKTFQQWTDFNTYYKWLYDNYQGKNKYSAIYRWDVYKNFMGNVPKEKFLQIINDENNINAMNNLQKENLERLLRINEQLNGIKPLKEMEEDDFEDVPDYLKDFDDLEFKTSAKDAAKKDIEKELGKGSFQDIGKNKFEKGKTEKEFSDEVNRAKLDLPSDKKELDKISKMQSDREEHEKRFGSGSLNETLESLSSLLYEASENIIEGKADMNLIIDKIKKDLMFMFNFTENDINLIDDNDDSGIAGIEIQVADTTLSKINKVGEFLKDNYSGYVDYPVIDKNENTISFYFADKGRNLNESKILQKIMLLKEEAEKKSPNEIVDRVERIRKDLNDKLVQSQYFNNLVEVTPNNNVAFKFKFFTNNNLERYFRRFVFRSRGEKQNYLADVIGGDKILKIVWSKLPKNKGEDIGATSIPKDLFLINFDFDEDKYLIHNRIEEAFEMVNEIADSNRRDYLAWKRKNVTLRGMVDRYSENNAGAMFGDGLYTAHLSNRAMARKYGKVYFVLNGRPKNPKKFQDTNQAEIYTQQLITDFCKEHGVERNSTYFYENTTIAKEMLKRGFDGLEVIGREMVNYAPPEDVKYFENEWQVEKYYDDFVA